MLDSVLDQLDRRWMAAILGLIGILLAFNFAIKQRKARSDKLNDNRLKRKPGLFDGNTAHKEDGNPYRPPTEAGREEKSKG